MFNCPIYAHVRDDKIELVAKKYIFLRYAYEVKGYNLWCNNPKSPKLIINKNVIFN